VSAQPDFVIAVRQDTAAGDKSAMAGAQREAIASAFWKAANAATGQIAPHAQLVAP
jgi:hypothetical protein